MYLPLSSSKCLEKRSQTTHPPLQVALDVAVWGLQHVAHQCFTGQKAVLEAGGITALVKVLIASRCCEADVRLSQATFDTYLHESRSAFHLRACVDMATITWYRFGHTPVWTILARSRAPLHSGICKLTPIYHAAWRTPAASTKTLAPAAQVVWLGPESSAAEKAAWALYDACFDNQVSRTVQRKSSM